jgi:hypothetical protein
MPTAANKATGRGANPAEAVSHLANVTDRMHGPLVGAPTRSWAAPRIVLKRPSWRLSQM